MKQITNRVLRAWSRTPLVIRAVLLGFIVSSTGIAIWSLLLVKISAPWPVIPMVFVLWVYLKWFGGSWAPDKTKEFRKFMFRGSRIPVSQWKWNMAAAFLFVIIVQSSFVITFRLLDFPAEKFTADYKVLDSMPVWSAWVILVMSSVVAGICEETGFRGYMQVPLEKRYGPVTGIAITSFIFMLIHLSHSWALPILPHIYFASVLLGILAYKSGSLIPGIIGHSILDIFDYSVWWSDIGGVFHRQTIFKTGIDFQFMVWILIFTVSVFGFFRIIKRVNQEKQVLCN